MSQCTTYTGGDDDDTPVTPPAQVPDEEDLTQAGEYNFGDDFEKVGEGHDPIEDETT